MRKEYFALALETANNLYDYLRVMNDDPAVHRVLGQRVNLRDSSESHTDLSNDTQSNRYFTGLDNRLSLMAANDVVRCYERLGHEPDLRSDEGLPVAMFMTRMIVPDNTLWKYDLIEMTPPYGVAQGIYDMVKSTFLVTADPDKLLLVELLRDSEVDREVVNKYVVLMHRLALVIAKADNNIDETEAKWLAEILSFGDNKANSGETDSVENSASNNCQDPMAELSTLIGLQNVKTEVEKIYNLLKIQKIRSEKGLKSSKISYHCVFTGNPGTGKTTVARIVAQIYRELGVLKKGHLVETDRSGLVAEYVGQTAVKTNKIIDSALDGVLFIDEAYSLVQGHSNDFGIEAISTLLKRMEDDRDRLAVIIAGYTDEMQDFIDANPGLQSRFNRYIQFDDYSVDELTAIFELNASKYDYTLSEDAKTSLRQVLDQALVNRDKSFGNARYVRNLFEKTVERQAHRLAHQSDIDETQLIEIKPEDIPTL